MAMKKHERRKPFLTRARSSLYGAIVFRYASFALSACLIIGFGILFFSAEKQHELAEKQNQARLDIAANYLSDQHEVMNDIADRLMIETVFKPVYFNQNSIYERDIIEQLARYKGYSPLFNDILLIYSNNSSFVYNTRYKSHTSLWLKNHLNISNAEAFMNLLQKTESSSAIRLEECRDTALFAYFVNITGKSDRSGDAWLVFVCPVDTMLEQLCRASGIEQQQFSAIYFDRQPVYLLSGLTEGFDEYQMKPRGLLSESGVFAVSAEPDSIWQNSVYRSFWIISLLIIIITTVCMILYAISAAKKNYKPIGDLVNRYHLPNENEITHINVLLDSLHQTNARAQDDMAELLEMLDLQKTQLREYLLLSLLGGTLQNVSDEQLERMGIQAHASFFCVIILHLIECDVSNEKVIQDIEAVSDSQVRLLAVSISERNYFAVIACGNDPLTLVGLPDVLRDVLYSEHCNVIASSGTVVCQINECSASMQSAIYNLSRNNNTDFAMVGQNEIKAIIEESRNGDEEAAKSHFRQLCQQIMTAFPISQMWQHFLLQAADELNKTEIIYSGTDRSAEYYQALLSSDFDRFEKCCLEMITEISAKSTGADQTDNMNELSQSVIGYLNEHVLDESMSLENIADHCNISVRQAERIIWNSLDISYKDYVTQCRIETAKKLLLQGKSVAETAEKVGYINVTYFIKRFRDKVGVTPGRYKDKYS